MLAAAASTGAHGRDDRIVHVRHEATVGGPVVSIEDRDIALAQTADLAFVAADECPADVWVPARDMIERCGFVALAAEYRLLPEAPWPAQLDDVRDVVRWTKANASALAIDPAKVALQGFSAGAHLALLVGGTQPGSGNEHRLGASANGTEVAAIVSFFAPAKLDVDPAALSRPPLSLLLNGGGIEAARTVSPIYYVQRSFPSTFIVGGMSDYMQPLTSGLGLLHAFVDVGAEVEFHYFHSQTHEFSSTPGMLSEVMGEVAFFYRRTLLEREALAAEARERNIFARASNPQEFARLVRG